MRLLHLGEMLGHVTGQSHIHSPVDMGLMCGLLHAVGPDHLGTLVSFTTLMEPMAAAQVGVAWGLGHSFGIIAIAALLVSVSRFLPLGNVMHLEYYGDYLIGASMVLVAIYFLVKEADYLETQADGVVLVKPCACHGGVEIHTGQTTKQRKKKGFCSEYSGQSDAAAPPAVPVGPEDPESQDELPLAECSTAWQPLYERSLKSAMVGVLQGMCCPMGLVGMSYIAGQGPAQVCTFLLVSVLVSVIGTGLIAAFWAWLTTNQLASSIDPRMVYRASCGFSLILGLLWIVANYLDVLDQLNYAERGMEMTSSVGEKLHLSGAELLAQSVASRIGG